MDRNLNEQIYIWQYFFQDLLSLFLNFRAIGYAGITVSALTFLVTEVAEILIGKSIALESVKLSHPSIFVTEIVKAYLNRAMEHVPASGTSTAQVYIKCYVYIN
jgi:hypothetical protein